MDNKDLNGFFSPSGGFVNASGVTSTWPVVGIWSFNFIDFRKRERERNICCSTYLCIHWLIFVTCPDGDEDGTHNIGVLGQRSNQLDSPGRAGPLF